jgi:osmotically-inducible protein OsmY
MKRTLWILAALTSQLVLNAAEISTFHSYVDSDICARLMLGPITSARVECSRSTAKDGADLVLVQLKNNMVFTPNNQKPLREIVGELAEATGELKPKDGTVKLQTITAIKEESIPAGDPSRKLLDVRTFKADRSAKLYEKIRHELAMMPYITNFDFISFTLNGSEVILTGWTVRQTNRSTAYNIIKDLEGVTSVVNNIDVLPLGSNDMRIRAGARAALQRFLSRYFWGSGSDIKIVVKNGKIILLCTVATKTDSDIAYIQCNGVPGAFGVFNLLRVENSQDKDKKDKKDKS